MCLRDLLDLVQRAALYKIKSGLICSLAFGGIFQLVYRSLFDPNYFLLPFQIIQTANKYISSSFLSNEGLF